MGEQSSIEWTDHTFNPWFGCVKVSPGCEHCYAETLSRRFGHDVWGPAKTTHRRLMSRSYWQQPLRWNASALAAGVRARVFCASMADVFESHPDVGLERQRLFHLIEQTPALDWLLLTKRPENIMPMVPESWREKLPSNIWAGTSVEDQQRAEERIPELLAVPAGVRFLSLEPLLGPVELRPWLWESAGPAWAGSNPSPDIDWLIVGGESGPGARPMHPEWARSLRDQAVEASCPFFFKQWGEYRPESWAPRDNMRPGLCVGLDGSSVYAQAGHMIGMREPGEVLMERVGKKAAGRLLDGQLWDQFPLVVEV